MPVHDWTRVDAGTFHAFHTLWIGEIMKALNAGLLPKGYYALAEQVATRMQTDVLTLRTPSQRTPLPTGAATGGVAVAEAGLDIQAQSSVRVFRVDPEALIDIP